MITELTKLQQSITPSWYEKERNGAFVGEFDDYIKKNVERFPDSDQ